MTTPRLATPKQMAFIKKLVEEGRTVPNVPTEDLLSLMPIGQASEMIKALLRSPRGTQSSTPQVTEPGMYLTPDGTIYKVQKAKQTSNLYAKKLVPINGRRLTETDEVQQWEFEYAPGALRSLSPDHRLSVEEAKAFGIRYGVCCVCGLRLKDATSVAAGIGPICVKRI